jgi:glycosyltransferase involved in cell wall biosynthesis
MKKLVIFIPSIESGGVEKILLYIVEFLSKKKIDIYIVSANRDKKKYFNQNIKFLCPINSNWNNSSRLVKTIICLKIIFTQLPKKNISFLSFQSNISAILLSKLFGFKIIIRLNTSINKYLSGFIKKTFFNKIYSLSDKIIVNSSFFKKELKKILHLDSTLILNPINLKKKIRKKNINYFKNFNGIKILSIGRLTDQKNQIVILEALNRLKINKIKFKFFLIGKGYKLNELKKYTKNKKLSNYIKFAGYKKDAFKYIASSDLFILSSKFEGLPNVIIEAQSQNIPIISSDCPTGPKEILLNGKLGTLFKVGDFTALSKEIIKFSIDKRTYLRKVKLSKKYLYRYDYDNNLNKYYKTIKTIL